MSIFAKLRKGVSDLRAQIQGVHAEIERLETERAALEAAPIRFDCWLAVMSRAIDLQADMAPNRIRENWHQVIRGNARGMDLINSPVGAYAEERLIERGIFTPAAISRGDAGLWFGVLLAVNREPLKRLFMETVEPLRAEWPADSKCGPTMEKRRARIAEIDAQLETLVAERDEAASVLAEIAKPAAELEEA